MTMLNPTTDTTRPATLIQCCYETLIDWEAGTRPSVGVKHVQPGPIRLRTSRVLPPEGGSALPRCGRPTLPGVNVG